MTTNGGSAAGSTSAGSAGVGGADGGGGGSSPVAGAPAGGGGTGTDIGGSAGSAGSAGMATGGGGPVTFPDGAVAAITLTYDDGLDPHLAVVQPALEAAGLHGTFFLSNFEGVDHEWALPNTTSPLNARHMAWQAAAQKGHELAGHTVNHPCNADSKAPGYKLTDYDLPRMTAELDDSLARLQRLGAVEPITFAYPCASDKAGLGPAKEDYSPLVAERFFAARVSVSGIADANEVELLHVPQLDTGGKTGEELKAMVDQAIAAKGWLVLLFHGVGVEKACPGLTYAPQSCMINYLTTSTEAHAALVQYLADKKSEVWTATFKEVATLIDDSRK
jgi:peptidoglycan/xylan/chitin deacetylase (PgdA/CDA1 family)